MKLIFLQISDIYITILLLIKQPIIDMKKKTFLPDYDIQYIRSGKLRRICYEARMKDPLCIMWYGWL